ncbi:hypothetical protein LEN26_000719 [Aphanomyces euteiches]|nr:hypothetical protein AeMF1_011236 [Aphanomyces euteiches]KAH9162970.1 hypothetical protein LEN26_000719 [Aphanomyces euteiches]KAH9191877.1 hypothetical protein AeNC1_006144 [Aphanomyces euteiches]
MSASTAASTVFWDRNLLSTVLAYQFGVSQCVHVSFRLYVKDLDAKLRRIEPMRRGYVLLRLLHDPKKLPIVYAMLRDCPVEYMCPIDSKYQFAIDAAVRTRSLAVVRFVHECRFGRASARAMDIAATNGDLEIVQYLHKHRGEGCTQEAFLQANLRKHNAVLKFLEDARPRDKQRSFVGKAVVGVKTKQDRLFWDATAAIGICAIM